MNYVLSIAQKTCFVNVYSKQLVVFSYPKACQSINVWRFISYLSLAVNLSPLSIIIYFICHFCGNFPPDNL